MQYTMADLEQATGLNARTIRQYMADGFLEPPKRKGLGAVYPESTFLKAVALARMRRQGEDWKTIGARLRNWPLKKLQEYVASTEPAPPAPPEPPPQPPAAAAAAADAPPPLPPPPSAPALEGEPVTRAPRLPHPGSAPREDLDASAPTDEEWLPDGPRWLLAPLLPGLALWIREDAAPIVRRTAAEILRRYGSP
jgi:DNA-binding transcriptional MerR regulator